MKKLSGFKMKGFSGFGNSPAKVDLTKKKGLGPRAKKKDFDRKKFEEYTRVMQGMENTREELFSDEMTHNIVKKNIKKKNKYPKSYTKKDIKFLEDQREDVVREEDKK
tara:strand:+ start:200 stop:523 length:324 start_codon:yes stop_codon:yes gene_type:complete